MTAPLHAFASATEYYSRSSSLPYRVFGKRFMFTDRHDWTDEQIVLAYRSQHHVEAVFHWMKAPAAVPFGPM